MEAYAVMLYFAAADVRIIIGQHGKPPFYSAQAACKRAIPLTVRQFSRLNIAVPDSYSCERIEIKP